MHQTGVARPFGLVARLWRLGVVIVAVDVVVVIGWEDGDRGYGWLGEIWDGVIGRFLS